MKRKKMAAANWKMNLSLADGVELAKNIRKVYPGTDQCDVVIAPPFTHLHVVGEVLNGTGIGLGAQNCHAEKEGAFTGEVSVEMLAEAGVTHIIAGHSERRQLFGETNAIIRAKVESILRNQLVPIFCCGETLEVRESGNHLSFVLSQLEDGLFHLNREDCLNAIVAYEPIWAIGTGKTATPAQAQEMHAFIREQFALVYGGRTSEQIRILYGGSIKQDNAAELFGQPDVDGGLVGGASLKADSFFEIMKAACG